MSNEFWDFLHALPSIIFLVGIIIAIWILARHNYLRKIDYFFAKIIFKTNNILVGRYVRGLNEKYDEDTIIYIALTDDNIIIKPIYFSFLRKTILPYTEISRFEIVLRGHIKGFQTEVDENQFPLHISDLNYILIRYTMNIGKEDNVTISFRQYVNYYKFNKYVYSKCNYFEKAKNQIPDKLIQSFNTHERTY